MTLEFTPAALLGLFALYNISLSIGVGYVDPNTKIVNRCLMMGEPTIRVVSLAAADTLLTLIAYLSGN